MLTVNIYEPDEGEEEKSNFQRMMSKVPNKDYGTPTRREATHIRRPTSILKGLSTSKNIAAPVSPFTVKLIESKVE